MNTPKRKFLILIGAVFLALILGASSCEDTNNNDQGVKDDEAAADQALGRYQDSQPVPEFDWSQLRQNLIEITTAQAQTTQTTTFFFNVGVAEPVAQCPSIGFPIASTAQITNPDSVVTPGPRERGTAVVGQIEPTGVYTGDSTGTYVICLDGDGNAYANYWEGYVSTVTGAAEFTGGEIRLVGDPTFDFSAEEE